MELSFVITATKKSMCYRTKEKTCHATRHEVHLNTPTLLVVRTSFTTPRSDNKNKKNRTVLKDERRLNQRKGTSRDHLVTHKRQRITF